MIFKTSIAALLGVLSTLPLAAEFNLTLTDSIVREYGADGGFPFTPSLSNSGDQAYVVYPINATSISQVIAEIFDNNSGTLSSSDTLLSADFATYPVIDNGYASPDFTRFSLVDDNNTDTIRIRVFNNTLTDPTPTTAIFTDYDPGNDDYSGNGGQWSADRNYLLMTYLTDAMPGNLTTQIRVLDSSTLNTLANTTIPGGSFGGIFLQFHGKTYVAVTSYTTTDDNDWVYDFDRSNAGPNNATPPPYASNLYVFEYSDGALNLIDSAGLPQAADAPSGVIYQHHAFIGVGTSRAIKPNEVSVFSNNSDKQSFSKTDGREERIYKFSGRSLELVYSNNANAGVQAPTFTPDGNYVIFDNQANDAEPGFFRAYKIKGHHHRLDLETQTQPFLSAPFYTGVVSNNGNWLLVTGSDQNSGSSQADPNSQMNDISLYQISY